MSGLKSPAVWACLGVYPLDMPRTPYRTSEGKRIIHLINWLQRFYRILMSLKRPFVPKSNVKQWFTTTTMSGIQPNWWLLYVQKVLCSEGPMFRKYLFERFYVQKVLYSEGPMFRRFYFQKVLYSEGYMFRKYLFVHVIYASHTSDFNTVMSLYVVIPRNIAFIGCVLIIAATV